MKRYLLPLTWIGVVAGGIAASGIATPADAAGQWLRSRTRSAVVGRHGMVATSQSLAAQVGIDILKKGGNAVDAAIAVNAMMGLTQPPSCGMGGDLFAIVWDAGTRALYGLNASGRAPYDISIEKVTAQGHTLIPTKGPLAWSVPGCVDGWQMLKDRFGTLSWDEILGPAIAYAEEGFPVAPGMARSWRGAARSLGKDPGWARGFLMNGRGPAAGEFWKNPDQAQVLRRIVQGGRDAFYRGEIAQRIVDFSRRQGGFFSLRDFEDHTSTWVDPVSTDYHGYDVWELPPNGQGIVVLQMLNIIEDIDLKAMGHNSADYLHVLIEAKKLAYEDRARYYADMDFARVPVLQLISKPYAAERRGLLNMMQAARELRAGDPRLAQKETIYLTIADGDGNMVSLIQSNYGGWGSGLVPPGLGFVLQNRGALFNLNPNHPNALQPHKRPFHTIIPAFVTKDSQPVFSFGVTGGHIQPQGQTQILNNMLLFGMDPQEAGDAPRFRHDGSSQPTGTDMVNGGTVYLQAGIASDVVDELARRGHDIQGASGSFGGYQGIWRDPATGALLGGTQPGNDGSVIGY